jgi:N-acyl-D-amino-acid deacylase
MARGFDLVITNGRVIDGTGSPWRKLDIGIKGDKIEFTGKITGNAARIIDTAGRVVAPGFIDLHSHTDHSILPRPNAESFIMQGITTCAVGNCGLSMTPVSPENRTLLKNYLKSFVENGYEYGWDWESDEDFFGRVAENGSAVNIAPLAGQGTIRIAAMGFSDETPTKTEMSRMNTFSHKAWRTALSGCRPG